MKKTSLAALLLALPAAAMGQDPAVPKSVGTTLLDALPDHADLVVATPNLPALFASAVQAGLGEAAAWRAGFDEQLRLWGAGSPSSGRLVTGGGALLEAADGEVVVASLALKLPDANAPQVRATLLAMRSTKDEKALRAAFLDVADGGLRLRYDGFARTEQIGGRPVLALPGSSGTLYVTIQDGLVVVCDHALALGLFFRGLSREQAPAASNRPPAKELLLSVRHGRGPAAWEGWIWGGAESVTWTTKETAPATFGSRGESSPSAVFVVAHPKVEDLPLFPRPVTSPPEPTPGTDCVGIDGGHDFGATGEKTATQVAGGAWRLGWLSALAKGTLELPLPSMDAAALRAPYASAAKLAGDKAGEFLAWKPSKDAGHLSGPIGHGPATMLALRTLHDIARGIAPGETAPAPRVQPKKRTDAPLPEPTERANK
jgi:hypothetical protein